MFLLSQTNFGMFQLSRTNKNVRHFSSTDIFRLSESNFGMSRPCSTFFCYLDFFLLFGRFCFCIRLYFLQALNARKLCHASVAELMPKSQRDKYDAKSHC